MDRNAATLEIKPFAPTVENNDVTVDAEVINITTLPLGILTDPPPPALDIEGGGIAIAQGITLYSCLPSLELALPTVDGNSVEATADVDVDVTNVPWLLLSDGSALAQLQSELDELYDIVMQAMADEGTVSVDPDPPGLISSEMASRLGPAGIPLPGFLAGQRGVAGGPMDHSPPGPVQPRLYPGPPAAGGASFLELPLLVSFL